MLLPLPPSVVRDFIYPMYRRLKSDDLLEHRDEFEKNQWLSLEDLRQLQWRKLGEFLKDVATHVPYYRDLFREIGLDPGDIKTPADFQKVPLLTKDDIRAAGKRMVSEDSSRKGVATSTSGSTGEPLYFSVDAASGPLHRANTLRALRWMNFEIGDRQARLWGNFFGIPLRDRLVDDIRNYFNNILVLSSFGMTEELMATYASKLRRFNPHLILAYPSAIAHFAEYCKSKRIKDIRPRTVLVSGEKSYPHQKELLAEVFGSEVFEGYGTNEFGHIANECGEHKGLHVFTDVHYVEVLHESGRPAQPGEVGEVVITDLNNLYMPFVRYRTGDLAIGSDRTCGCGRGLPLLESIEGRTFDVVMSGEGKSAGGFFWTYLSRAVPGIKQYQIEQRDRGGVIFRIVKGPDWKEQNQAKLEQEIKSNMGDTFGVAFEFVDHIPMSRSGKFRFIVSKIEERMVVKSKIHKAHVTGEDPGAVDGILIDQELMDMTGIAPCEKVLIVDNDNGARVETFARAGKRGGGEIVATGPTASHIHAGDEIIVMAFTWSEETGGHFKNILVDENNRFVRYLTEVAGMKI
jgi:phenylacetate-CoA ligase